MICLNAGSFSACRREINKLFPRDRMALRYFSGSKLSPWKAPSSSNKVRLMTRMFSSGVFITLSFRAERSEVEAATQRTQSARPGFQSRRNADGVAAGSLDFARDDRTHQTEYVTPSCGPNRFRLGLGSVCPPL